MMMEVMRILTMMMTTTTTTTMMMMMMIFEKLRPKNAIPRGLPPHNISFHTTKSFDEKANSALNIAAMWFSSDIASPVVVHTQVWVECWFLFYGVSYIFQSDENYKSYNTKRYLEIRCFFLTIQLQNQSDQDWKKFHFKVK